MPSYQYRNPHDKDKTVSRSSYILMVIHIPGKVVFVLKLKRGPACHTFQWYIMSMVQYKTAISPLLTHWRYCSLALSHRCQLLGFQWTWEVASLLLPPSRTGAQQQPLGQSTEGAGYDGRHMQCRKHYPTDTWRNDNVIITSKRRRRVIFT